MNVKYGHRLWITSSACLIGIVLPFAAADAAEPAATRVVFEQTLTGDSSSGGDRYRDLQYRPSQWYGSTFFAGPNWTRVGKDWQHPGEDTPSVRCFVAPRNGHVTVTGRVFKRHLSGDGVRATISINDVKRWETEIAGDDGEGASHSVVADVNAGDPIRFTVHKRGTISCDTTGWDPSVQYDDGTRYLASAAFDKHLQSADGWRYEMDASSGDSTGAPTVWAWSLNLGLEQYEVRAGRPIEVNGGSHLPLIIVENRTGTGGLGLIGSTNGSWAFNASIGPKDSVRVRWVVDRKADASSVVLSQPYRGQSEAAWEMLQKSLNNDERFVQVNRRLSVSGLGNEAPLALRAMIQLDWKRQDAIDGSPVQYTTAVKRQLRQTQTLIDRLRERCPDRFLAEEAGQLSRLAEFVERTPGELPAGRETWLSLRRLKRRIALANPLLKFGPMLVCKRVPPSWSHLVAQYFGWRQRSGGGLFIVDRPGYSLETRDLLHGQLPPGSVLEPRLSYDGQRILFAFVACDQTVPDPASLLVNERGSSDRYFHLYEMNIDGSGLRQLTDGPYDDMMAEYLPSGDIIFCSTRRKGYSRCFGPEYSYRWHSYTLHRMDANGGDLRTLSFNDVNEWFPAVLPSGAVLHARWDYIDRDAVTHQNLWSIRPDGTHPATVWGNATPKPNCCFQARPVPNSRKIVLIAAAHHAITAGPVCLLDPSLDPNSQQAITRITPLPFPESEGNLREWYAAPWPLSEQDFLVAYSPYRLRFQGEHQTDPNPDNALGVYLIDAAGNRELLYRDPSIGTTNPIPLIARPCPPVLPDLVRSDDNDTGTMFLTDVYQGLGDVPRGTIKQLRIVQVFPKSTWLANQPRMGVAGEENGRAILGTVPVEADGSAFFEVPAGKPILFQALDETGMAYQTMRSLTFVQPGERAACVGCHESQGATPRSGGGRPLAAAHGPTRIQPGPLGGRPFGYVEMVQPVLDRHCVGCHGADRPDADLDLTGKLDRGFTRSYWSLCGTPESWSSSGLDLQQSATHWVPRFVQRNQIQQTPPGGANGARGSRLMRLLLAGHEGVRLSRDDIRRLAAWIDLNAIFYGVYDAEGQARQIQGRPVAMPELQ